jgi:SHOCT-like protein
MYKIEKTFTSETRSGLKVLFKSENVGIKIKGVEGETSVLDLNLEYKSSSGKEYDVADFLTIKYDNDKNEMKIEFIEPESMKIFKAKLELEIPVKSQVTAVTENGPIAFATLEGSQEIKTENGPVALLEITGSVRYNGENGPLNVQNLIGDIDVKIENGPVNIKEYDGNCNIKGENGIVKIKDGKGELFIANENGQIRVLNGLFQSADIKNENGGIYYEFQPLEEGKFSFQNENGKISLVVPDEIQCDLTTENELGNINISIDGNYEKDKVKGKTVLHLLKGSGRIKITASNQNGSINVTRDRMKVGSGFNISGFSGIFDEIMTSIPEKDMAEVKIKLEKAKEKFENIDIDKIEEKINKAASKFEEIVEKEFDIEKNGKILTKVKLNLAKAMENLNSKLGETDDEAEETQSKDKEKSRLMILQMLQDGKISSEEAEKLLKAIGD